MAGRRSEPVSSPVCAHRIASERSGIEVKFDEDSVWSQVMIRCKKLWGPTDCEESWHKFKVRHPATIRTDNKDNLGHTWAIMHRLVCR
jgi:hypothetical protein